MPVAITACRPVQIKIAVDNAEEAAVFYRDALGARCDYQG
jgi:catechol 2,3-dioxygenase-like lactoylglutathione lyase family enzyme